MEKSRITFDHYTNDYNEAFTGWDFAYLSRSGRMQEFPLSWNYYNEIMDYCRSATSLLDMGTGGGEFLANLPFLPPHTEATEGYVPNIAIAQQRLEPLGIKVSPVEDDDHLPFKPEVFDLVINRHESYSPSEVKRILRKNGFFITQQVGGANDLDLNLLLGAPDHEFVDWELTTASKELQNQGFEIVKQKDELTKMRFFDIGAVIYYLKAIPWQVPDFSVQKYHDRLFAMHEFIERQGFLDVTCHRFLMIARKIG